MEALHSSPFLFKGGFEMKFFKMMMLTSAVAMAMVACNGGGNPAPQRTEADAARKAKADPTDSTMYVVLNAVKGDSVYVTNSETNRKMALSVKEVGQNGNSHGALTPNDKFALMVDLRGKMVRSAINMSELEGLWLLCDKSGNGMRLDEDGSASNVGELGGITLRSWRVMNGQFVVSHVKSDGSDYEEKEEKADIVLLSADRLSLVMNGRQYDFSRN